MIPLNIKDLFNKEPKKIIRTIGGYYSALGAWCLFVMLMIRTIGSDFPSNNQSDKFNNLLEILQNIWITHLPVLIVIGLCMLTFSFAFERLNKYTVDIQTGILVVSTIWGISYSFAILPYIEAFQQLSPAQDTFKELTYVMGIFGFGVVFALMTFPNYLILKKLKAENNDM